MTNFRPVLAGKSRLRAAISRLAPKRLRSHSKGPGDGLVEVVDVEEQVPFGRGKAPEVAQVGVAAELDIEARAWPGGKVRGHWSAAPR